MAPSNELKQILDEIEADYASVRLCLNLDTHPCPDCSRALNGLALVKALREAPCTCHNPDGSYPHDATNLNCYLNIVTAILNQGREDKKPDLGEKGGQP